MNILYFSCHAILEYDELKMFQDLKSAGHDINVLSMGSYSNPRRPVDEKRPALEGDYDDELVSAVMQGLREQIVPSILERFDACVVMHKPEWVVQNWETFKEWGKPVVWRSIGQSIASVEAKLKPMREEGLHVVRYSPAEANIPGYIGSDALIRFAKYPEEWDGWTGEGEYVAIIGQRIVGRGRWCNADVLDTITCLPSEKDPTGIMRRVYGPDNAEWGKAWAGLLEYEDFKQAMREARCLAYGGTVPACYTLVFVEALMTGLPVVSVGPNYANRIPELVDHRTFEVQNIIDNGVDGFVSDDPVMLRSTIAGLLQDYETAKRIGQAGRQRALELFDAHKIKLQWLELFRGLGLL